MIIKLNNDNDNDDEDENPNHLLTSAETSLLDSSGDRLANRILLGVSAPVVGVADPETPTPEATPGRTGVPEPESDEPAAAETNRLAVRDLDWKWHGCFKGEPGITRN